MFVLFAASAIAPLGKGVAMYGWAHMEEMVGLRWVLAQGATYAIGLTPFLVGVLLPQYFDSRLIHRQTQWPESSNPGKYDTLGASHQLFHIAVVLAASVHFVGLLLAYEFQHSHYEVAICPMLSIWKGNLIFTK